MALIGLVRRWPLAFYFVLVYLLSGVALAVIGLPMLHGGGARTMLPLVIFPVMVIGVGLAGIALTAITSGTRGLRELVARFRRPVPWRWLAVLLIPPGGILAVLGGLSLAVSSRFIPPQPDHCRARCRHAVHGRIGAGRLRRLGAGRSAPVASWGGRPGLAAPG